MRLLVLAYVSLVLFSLSPPLVCAVKPYNQYLQERWSIEDGLLQVVANTIVQDDKGYIWIGAQFGLTRFDGVRFKTFTEKDSPHLDAYIQKLFVDSQGRMWIATNRGLLRYKNSQFQPIYISKDNEPNKFNTLDTLMLQKLKMVESLLIHVKAALR